MQYPLLGCLLVALNYVGLVRQWRECFQCCCVADQLPLQWNTGIEKKESLQLVMSSACRVTLSTKLGRQRHRTSILPLSAVKQQGGPVPRTLVVVHRQALLLVPCYLLFSSDHFSSESIEKPALLECSSPPSVITCHALPGCRVYPQLLWVKMPSGIDMYMTERQYSMLQQRSTKDIEKVGGRWDCKYWDMLGADGRLPQRCQRCY